jgi:cell division protein FtsQ
MASSSSRRSSYSASGRPTARPRARGQQRPTTVKGRPSQSRNLRPSASTRAANSRPQRRTSRSTYERGHASTRGFATGRPIRSVSVSEVRNESRYRARAAKSRRGLYIFMAILIVAAVVGVAGLVLSHTNVFTVEKVTVSGADHISSEDLTELAAVPSGTTLLNVDVNGICSRLTSNAWVKSASVDRVFPDTLNLRITEREISAVVSVTVDDTTNTKERWALSSDGMWLCKIPDDRNSAEGKTLPSKVYEDVDEALEITDIPYGSKPEAGTYCNNANVENALGVIAGMTTELAGQVKSVAAASSDSTTLTLQNGVEIAFGDSKDIRDKERVCLELMAEHEGKISYINVRVVNKPVYRSL